MRARLGVLWARLGLWLFGSPLHSPALIPTHDEVPTEAPFQIVGVINGVSVKRAVHRGAIARDAFYGLLTGKPTGWLEFRQDGQVRTRYERVAS